MRKIFLTNYNNLSSLYFNLVWNSYEETKNSISLIKYIDNNSTIYKKKTLNELQKIYKLISDDKILNKKLLIGKNFNFLDTFLISEKSFYKDKHDNLSNMIKCLALVDKINDLKIDEIIFNIDNVDVHDFLSNYCKSNNIKFTVENCNFYQSYITRFKVLFGLIYNFLSFFKFVFRRLNIPKKNKSFLNKKNIIFDYFCYFDEKKFISGKYVSNYWGKLIENIKSRKNLLFCHIYMDNLNLTNNQIITSFSKFNKKNSEQHFIIDSVLNFKIIFKIYKKWSYFVLNYFFIKIKMNKIFKRDKKNIHIIFRKSIVENLIGFNGLLNLYYFYLFKELFDRDIINLRNKNFFYLCENQGWEKSLLSFIEPKKQKVKIHPIISTPIRFWDLRYNFLNHELASIKKKVTKFCVMSSLSKKILIKNKINDEKISIVESLRYESLNKKNIVTKKLSRNIDSILIIGDYLKSTNKIIESITFKLLKENTKLSLVAKPHPSTRFSKKFENESRIKITNENLYKLSLKTNYCICSNMTSAAYDIFYLNLKLLVVLTNDSINFSPLKDMKGVEYIGNFKDIKLKKKLNNNISNFNFNKNAFLFNKNYTNWSKFLK